VFSKGKKLSYADRGLYFLWKGSARITLDGSTVSSLRVGSCCGIGLLRDPLSLPKADCVVESASATFLKLPKAGWRELTDKYPFWYARIRCTKDPILPSQDEIEQWVQKKSAWKKYCVDVVRQEKQMSKNAKEQTRQSARG